MYLSRMAIDTNKHDTMKALNNMEKLHGMIENSFSGGRERRLWRLDRLAGMDYILLLSPTMPENESLSEQIGFANGQWETKSYETLLLRITEGSRWHFRLTANPTVSFSYDGNSRGKVKAVTVSSKQREWIKKQSEKHGFLLQDGQYDVVHSEWKCFKKRDREVRILAATFEGVLTVTDPALFKMTLISGLGREKAYGMGLLTVVPYG